MPAKHEADKRRFAYPHRMLMMLAGGKPFRAGPPLAPWRRKRSAMAMLFLDDASRFALGIVVGAAQPIRASPAAV